MGLGGGCAWMQASTSQVTLWVWSKPVWPLAGLVLLTSLGVVLLFHVLRTYHLCLDWRYLHWCTSCFLIWATGTSLIQPTIFPVVFPRLLVLLSSAPLGAQEVRPTWPSSTMQMAALSWHRLACSAASWWRISPSFTNRGSYLLVYLYLFS